MQEGGAGGGGVGGSFDESLDGDEDKSEIDLLNHLERLAIDEGDGDLLEASGGDDVSGTGGKERIMVASNPVFDFKRLSSKMKMIFDKVEEILSETDDKIVIVSQWSSVLRVLEQHANERRMSSVKMTGEVQVKHRGEVIERFNQKGSGSPRIMFLSLTAGGVGLNLVSANHLFLVDLHWNPQLEQQAQDRVYRFGQQKPVTIYKFVTRDSIEQKIQRLQEQKMEIAEQVLTGSKSTSASKLTIADLKMLFDM